MPAGKQSHDSKLTQQCCFQTTFSGIFEPLTIFAKNSVVNVRLGSKHASDVSFEFIFYDDMIVSLHVINELDYSRILENLAGCRTMLLFEVFCKIGALEHNAY